MRCGHLISDFGARSPPLSLRDISPTWGDWPVAKAWPIRNEVSAIFLPEARWLSGLPDSPGSDWHADLTQVFAAFGGRIGRLGQRTARFTVKEMHLVHVQREVHRRSCPCSSFRIDAGAESDAGDIEIDHG